MGSVELPNRAKPEALHTLCRHLRSVSGSEKTEIYDKLNLDRRQIRASIDYGAKLGFLAVEDGHIQNTDRGAGISYSESPNEKPVQTAFREAIGFYEPYRDTLLRIYAGNLVDTVKGNPAIKQSAFKQKAEASTGEEHTDREINLLIKTAQAAGLGDFVTGRKGFETRLEISDGYAEFLSDLAEEYPTPKPEETVQEESTETSAGSEADVLSTRVDEISLKADSAGEKVNLKVEYDVTDKNINEIANIVQLIRGTE